MTDRSSQLARALARATRPDVLIRVAALAVVFTLALLLPQPVRAILIAPLVLVLPGLAVEVILLPGLLRRDPVVALALATVLSLALVALVVILFYGLTGDVRKVPWLAPALLAAAWIVIAHFEPKGGSARRWLGRRARPVIGIVLAVCATAGAATATTAIMQKPLEEPSSAIALDGRWSSISTLQHVGASPVSVQVRVYNDSKTARRYRVVPQMTAAAWKPIAITVPAGGSWRGTVSGVVPSGGCAHRLLVNLEGASAAGIRGLTVWFTRSSSFQRTCLDANQ